MVNGREADRLRTAIETAPVFQMDRESEPDQYRKESFALVELLCRYVALMGGRAYEDMGLEIVETAHNCLAGYNREKGPFLHYFLVALKRRVKREAALRSAAEERGDVALPEHVQRQLFQLKAIARAKERPEDDEMVLRAAVEVMGLSEDRVRALLRLDRRFRSVSDCIQDTNQEETSLFDLMPGAPAPEDSLLEQQSAREFLEALECRYLKCRKGQQEVLSKVLTVRILAGCPPNLFQQCSQAAYFDWEMYDICRCTGVVPSSREIAARLGKTEASVSRTVTQFLKQLPRP